MTKEEIFATLVAWSVYSNNTGIGKAIFEAAKSGDEMKVVEVTSNFIKENTITYQKMYDFVNNLNKLSASECEIFGSEENIRERIFMYNSRIISASSLFVLSYLTDFDEAKFFTCEYSEEDDEFVNYHMDAYYGALYRESRSYDFSNFVANAMFTEQELACLAENGLVYDNKYKLLVDVFAGKLKEYVRQKEE